MKAAFAEFKKRGKKGSASISLVGMNNEQIEYLPELMKATGRYGIAVMREGIYKAKEWFDNIREAISDDMKDIGFKDADIDEYIREMWHMPWEMDGETHKIGEWASIKGYANLRESLKEPLRKKFDKQVLAEATEVKVGDRKNIEETLPFLLPQQQDDVLKAETQFFDESHKDKAHAGGKGYMFTNGTGTGKTYTGLGIIKRMTKQGKGRILIVTPSQQKVKDWINDGKNLCLDIRDLDDWSKEHGSTATNEKGEGVVITTFANFGTNKALLEDQFDAVIYDESHRIMENKGANETARSRQHYMLTNRNERYALMRLEEINPDCMKMRGLAEDFEDARKKETARIKAEYEKNNPSADAADVRIYMAKNTPKDIQAFSMADKAKFPELGKIYEDYRNARDYYINNVKPELEKQAKESVDKTKVVFLSATPFNTRENIEYAEGYLFSYPERNESGQSGKAQFFLEHFGAGYKFRYNRLESSTANAEALAKQEVAFSDWLQNDLGTMSGRIIDSPYDYSRDFPTVSVEHAREFNEACEEISRDDVFGAAYREVLGDYNYGSALFETMKVAAMLPRLREHIAAGRKVVVFHRRVSSKEPLQAPFGMILGENAEKAIKKLPKDKQPEARVRLNELRSKYSELLKWEQTLDFSMPREQLAKAFGEDNVLYFSGQESSKVKNEAVKQFNDDNSGKNIIVIQEASGKEGISLHDTTGKHQRVCITLALPQSPITALQIEGRTYRIGNESNAIFEYPVLGLVSEYNLFASKFNQQVSTTENLALGSQARNLRESFARGIEEHSGYVPLDQQGVGGKDFDKADESGSDPYDNAVLDYYTNQKLNRNNREGVDYFPTPEPLGYKIVEWANIGEGDSVLEPSAGHGAIARYAPQTNELVAIEPSMSLFAKLQMKAGGLGRKFQNETFENYYIGNKHDTIVMNPPFGKAGATAIAHVEKAFGHLEEGGRVVAIIPRGAMDKKFDKWYEGEKSAVLRAEIDLPDIVFEQAGTKVRCRVVVVDKITDASLRARAEMTQVDLSRHYDKIEDFFEDLRDVEVPERIIDQQAKQMKKSKAAVSELRNMRGVYDVSLDRDGLEVGARGVRARIEFKENESADAFKKRMAGLYDQFAQDEKRCANYNMDASAVYGELKDLTCKLADMTEDEMRRYLTSKNSNSYDEGGVRFRKGEGTVRYAKESRIIPQDVDKEVSSQIEKKFDEDIEKAFPDEKERRSAESVIYDFAERYSYMKTSEIIDNVNEWKENDGRERRNGGENTSRGHYTAVRFKSAMLASEREMEYRRIRANRIKSLFGIEGSGRQIPVDGISKAFEETKGRESRGREILFRASLDIARRLGTKFYLEEAGPKASHAGVTDTNREIRFFLDGLTRTATKAEEFNVTIVHELLHQSVNGAINLVKKGKAEGFLSEKQIDGAKTILDIYNKVKGDKERFKENTYGLKSEYEFAAQMADQRQRQALDTDIFERVVSAARELVKKGDYSLWQRVKDALGKLFGTSDLKKMDKALNNIMDDFKEVVHDYSMDDIEQEGFGYKVNDPEEIERLEKEPKVKVYRAMQVIDGKLYPPMAAKVRGGLVEPRELGEWERADENPDLAIPDIDKKTGKQKVDKKTGELKWKFKLDKGGKDAKGKKLGGVPAAYNPYWHTSRSPLNDQFSSAYKRPNLRVVEVEVPESELTSGYKAERAKDAVGEMAWHSGPVSSKLPKEKERKVILSRWDKPVRVLSDAEAADKIAEMLKGEDIEIPDNTITPGLKAELIKRGLKVTETDEVKAWNESLRFRDEDSKLNSEDSEKLFASLQNKKGKEYYDTVTELANRVKQGRARTMRLGEEVERKGMESFPLSVFRLLATSNKNLSGAFRSSIETRPDTMEEREPSAETIQSVNLATQKRIIDWAKENGYKFDESDIKKDSFDGKAWNEDGWESIIYRSKDGKSVIKYTRLCTLYNNPTLRYLDRTMCFNHLFPDTAIDVIGFGYDNDGQFSMVTKQPLIEGKTLDKYFNGDDAKIREYTDNFLKELGYTQKTLNEEGYEADSNGKFILFDLNKGNIIIDKEGKPHVIDCEVLPVGYDKINSFEIKDDAAQGDTRFRNDGEMTPEERREERRLEEHRSTVAKAAEKLNTDVTICESIDDVTNAEARAAIERGERVKAWYDTRTGEVHLYLPNVTDKYDAQKSIAHEVIGHKGMRGLLGEDGYRTMLRRMYTHLSDAEAREVNERMMRNGWDFYTAMDEWVADKAEESVWQPQEYPKYIGLSNLWSHIKKSVTDAMHKAGYYINPNVDDVRYWLWESKRALKDGNAETEMRRNAFLWKLGHEKMNDDVVMGEYTGEGEAEREMEISTLFRSTSIDENKHDTLEKRSQKQQIDDILKSSAYRHTEAFGDSDISLKTTIEVMSKGLPDGMNDSMNFYDGNNQLSSVVYDRMERFMHTTGKQLDDVIRKCRRVLGGKDRDFDRLNLYAIVKHGLERNRWLYVRKAAEALDKKIREMNAAISKDGGVAIASVYGDALKTEFLDFAKRKREELYSGGISYGDYLHALDGFIKDYTIDMESIPENERGAVSKLEKWLDEHFSDVYTAGGNDYSGLRGIEELRTEEGIDDAAAIDRVSSMENELGEELTRELWTNTKSVTFAGLEWQYKHGLISKKQFEQTQELFAYYVPLRGFSKETMEDQYAYMRGGSGEGKGSLIMKAEGRKSLSVSPFSMALYQANIAIEHASRNQNNQRAWRFALAWTKNNTEIGEDGKVKMKEEAPILISDVWYKKNEDGVWEVSAPEITEGMSADEVRSAVEAHESEMRSLQAEGKAKKRLTDKDRVPFGSAFEENSHRNEHVVDVWMNGERKRLIFMNPKAAQALNGELNKGQTDSIYRYLRKGLRTMSSLMTTYNATFAGRNFIRDYQFANNNVFIKEGRAYWLQMCKNQMRLLGERVDKDGNVSLMHVLSKHNLWFKLWRDYRNDVAPRTEVERYFKEFMENGGRTGFNEALKVDKLEDNLRKASEAGNAKNFALHMLGGMGEVMDYLNERAENFNRFATYMTSRQTGRSVMRSIADAKNVTVNFNRRGAGSKAFGDRASRKDKVLGFVYDYVGSNHVFVNAAIQGYRIFAGNLRHHPVKTLGTMILPPMIMGQVVVPMLNAWLAGSLFDEEGDPYSTLSDWDRRNNICLYSGKGKWVKIPLAIEHRAFYGMGDLINAYTGKLLHKSGGTENGKTNWLGSMANESLVTPTKFGLRYGAAYDFTWGMIRQMLEIAPYNPVGSNGNVVSNVVFGDYISPVVEAARNEDWAGKPIYKDTPWNKDDPEWQRVFKGENAGLVYLSKKLNDWSLGDDYTPGLVDINPALVSHFITSYLGGAATDIIKLTDLAANFTEGAKEGWQKKDGNKVVNTLKGGVKNTRTDDVAIVRAFYSMPTEKTKYYRALNKYATYKKYLEAYGERMDKKLKSDNVEFVKEANAEIYHNGVDMQRFHILDAYEEAIRNAIKYRNGKDVSEADKAIVDEDINMMKMEAVKEMESIYEAKPIKKKR